MAARMISLLRLKGRRVTVFVRLGAACLMLMMFSLPSVMVLAVLWGVRPALSGCCLASDGLNSRVAMLARPHPWGETSVTVWHVGSDTSPHHPQNIGLWVAYGHIRHPVIARNGGCDANPVQSNLSR